MRCLILSSALLLLFCCTVQVNVANSQMIHDEVCNVLASLFKSYGCLTESPAVCRFFAILFTLHTPTGGILCDKFLCDGGYGQSPFDTQCQESACSESRLRPRGICAECQTCCTVEM